MTTKQMLQSGMSAAEMAKQTIDEAKAKQEAKNQKVSEVAKVLGIELDKARKMIEQELARAEASKKYRQGESYKRRLEQQKQIRRLLKEAK